MIRKRYTLNYDIEKDHFKTTTITSIMPFDITIGTEVEESGHFLNVVFLTFLCKDEDDNVFNLVSEYIISQDDMFLDETMLKGNKYYTNIYNHNLKVSYLQCAKIETYFSDLNPYIRWKEDNSPITIYSPSICEDMNTAAWREFILPNNVFSVLKYFESLVYPYSISYIDEREEINTLVSGQMLEEDKKYDMYFVDNIRNIIYMLTQTKKVKKKKGTNTIVCLLVSTSGTVCKLMCSFVLNKKFDKKKLIPVVTENNEAYMYSRAVKDYDDYEKDNIYVSSFSYNTEIQGEQYYIIDAINKNNEQAVFLFSEKIISKLEQMIDEY